MLPYRIANAVAAHVPVSPDTGTLPASTTVPRVRFTLLAFKFTAFGTFIWIWTMFSFGLVLFSVQIGTPCTSGAAGDTFCQGGVVGSECDASYDVCKCPTGTGNVVTTTTNKCGEMFSSIVPDHNQYRHKNSFTFIVYYTESIDLFFVQRPR